jgi:tRNA-binding EMAP/Myf-like protein
MINIEDFAKLDLRVAKVLKAEPDKEVLPGSKIC